MDAATDLPRLLARAAQERPDAAALVEPASGRRTTWRQLDDEVGAVAQGFARLGLVAGHRVLICVGNRAEFVTSYLGALRARLVAVPVNPRSATGELVRMVADSGARLVIADSVTATSARAAVAGLQDALEGADDELRASTPVPRIAVVAAPALPGEIRYADLATPSQDDPRPAPAAVDPEALAVLLYTSGTSGRPRGAMLSQRSLVCNVEQVAAIEPPFITGEDVVLGVLPLFHVYGLNAVLGQVLRQGARLVLVDEFDPERVLDVIVDEQVTVLPVAPAVFAHWAKVDGLGERLRGVRLVLSGSAPLSPDLVAAFTARTGHPVHQGYGLTEAAPVVTSTLGGSDGGTPAVGPQLKPGSVGRPVPGVELRLADETGARPHNGDPGEIQLRGANLFSGYWPDGAGGPGLDGWYGTGDVGLLDADGDLFLVDRLKELVIVSGFNVYPSEVEEVVVEVDGVAEAAVIGVPDEESGEAVAAYVVPEPGTSLAPAELAAEVREHCASRLARFKQPVAVHVVDRLPHTVTGKVAKGRLRDTARRRTQGLLE
ncbi:MAG TPA: AMP-binding protein [Nocardioidaceae bacterium]|nr:AMP-binding protein [Nocardioidaceae bacterium]